MTRLTPNEKLFRVLLVSALPAGLLLLKVVPPEAAPIWLPTSCGAVSGLPCIFCGGTRAIHYLLNGDFSRALYLNWLAFPLTAGIAVLFGVFVGELSLGRKFVRRRPAFSVTRATVAGCSLTLLLLWGLQVYLAVSQHKSELLNPDGPLYSLIVR